MIQAESSQTSRGLWKRNEARTIRPFRDASTILSEVEVRYSPEHEFRLDERVGVSDLPAHVSPALRIPEVCESVEVESGIEGTRLEFVVLLENVFFKTSDLLVSMPYEQLVPGVIELVGAPSDSSLWTEDVEIRVAIVLREQLERKANTAYRKSSWLAEKRFGVSRKLNRALFNVTTVSPEFFEQRHLPVATLWHIEIEGDLLNQSDADVDDALRVFVQENLVRTIDPFPDSPITEALYSTIVYDVVSMVLSQGAQALKGSLVKDSILESIVTEIAVALNRETGDILAIARSGGAEPDLRSIVQAFLDMKSMFLKAGGRAK